MNNSIIENVLQFEETASHLPLHKRIRIEQGVVARQIGHQGVVRRFIESIPRPQLYEKAIRASTVR